MVLFCIVSEIRRLIGWKLRIFPTPLLFGAPAPYVPFGISRWSQQRGNYRVMGLLVVKVAWSELQPSLTDPPVWRTDRRTDRRAMAYSAL